MDTRRDDSTPPGGPPPVPRFCRMPPGATRLKAGDRVAFDRFDGVDGPPYALNVCVVAAANDEKASDES